MHIKGKYSWLKHLDFMVLDILSLAVAFVMAIGIRFGDFSLVTSDSWKTLLLIACLMDLLVILFTNPFSGIFRRYGSEELLKAAAMTGYNSLLVFFLLPVKVKYLALLDFLGLVWLFIQTGWSGRLAILMALLNILLFFGPDLLNRCRSMYRRWQYRRSFR